MMGGLDWQALPIVVDLLGIADVELLVTHLLVLRDNPGLLDHGQE